MKKAISPLIAFGLKKEEELKPLIERTLKGKLNKFAQQYAPFDFYSCEDDLLVELKSRRFNHDKYPTTMIGLNKLKYIENVDLNRLNVYFFFSFYDGLYYFKYTTKDHKYTTDEKHLYIPIEDLTKA